MKLWKDIAKWLVKVGLILGGLFVIVKLILDAVSDNTDTEAEEVTAKVDEIIIATTEKEERLEQAKKEHEEILDRKKERDEKATQFFPDL